MSLKPTTLILGIWHTVSLRISSAPACSRTENINFILFHFSILFNRTGSLSCQKYIPAPSFIASMIKMAYFPTLSIFSLSKSKALLWFQFIFLAIVSKGDSLAEKSVPKNKYTFVFMHKSPAILHNAKVFPQPALPMTTIALLLNNLLYQKYL